VSSVEAVLFGSGSQWLRKYLLARETRKERRKNATIFTALILKIDLYLQK